MDEKKCRWCGKPISGRRNYCDDYCWNEAKKTKARNKYREKQGLAELTVTCKWCGEEFTTYKANQEYCCEDHRLSAMLKRNIEKNKAERQGKPKFTHTNVCQNCGELFDTENPRVRYCCDECRKEYQRTAERERYHAGCKVPKKNKKRTQLSAKKIQTLHDQGMTYAEWQIAQTKSMLEPIRTVL